MLLLHKLEHCLDSKFGCLWVGFVGGLEVFAFGV